MLTRLADKSLFKWLFPFVTEDDEPDIEERARKTLFLIFMLILCIPLFFVGLHHIVTGFTSYGIINMVLSASMLLLLPLIKRIRRGIHLYRLICLIFWLLLFYWIYTAAMNGYASIWAILYPVFVFFLLGKKEGFFWSTSIVVVCVLFFYDPFHFYDKAKYSDLFASRHLGTLLFVFFLTFYYESIRDNYRDALDHDRRELKLHRDKLEILVSERTDELRRKNVELETALDRLKETTTRYLKTQIEKEKMQNQLAHSQKMEAIGTLAGGFAHDFNNLLGGILGSFNLLDIILKNEDLRQKDSVREYLELGIESTRKSSQIIKQLLTLSRRQEFTLTPVDLNDALHNVLSICTNSLPKSVSLDFRFSLNPITVMAEPVYLEQVFLNLCINGAHAMTSMRKAYEQQGGTLTVVPEVISSDSFDPAEMTAGISGGEWARIRVIDNGVGIPEENRARIFEPFFTTKQSEGGSGLGLATSYGIIQQHGGFITVQPGEERGSVFSVYLSLADPGRLEDAHVSARAGIYGTSLSGTVLVIDDEPSILEVSRGYLEIFGCKALTADTPARGVSIFRDRHPEIKAVLLDLSMPGRSGLDVYMELSGIDPGVKVILCSGLVESETKDAALSAGIKKILNKPYDADSLFRTLCEVLEGE